MPPTISSAISRTESPAIGKVPTWRRPHHGDLVGDPEQLVQPVRDVDDRHTGLLQPPDHAEQHVDLGVGEDRRRFVQDEQLRLAGQRLGDRHLLLLGDRQAAHRRGRVADRHAQQVQQLDDLGVLAAQSIVGPLRSSRPRKMFSETDSSANSAGSW